MTSSERARPSELYKHFGITAEVVAKSALDLLDEGLNATTAAALTVMPVRGGQGSSE